MPAGTPLPRWDELAQVLAAAPPSAARSALLLQLAATRASELPARLLAAAAEAQIEAGARDRARDTLAQAERLLPMVDDPEVVRRLALAAANAGVPGRWAECYAVYCTALFASAAPVRWPRRTAGRALRVVYLIAPERGIDAGGAVIATESYLRAVIAQHPRERLAAAVYVVGNASLRELGLLLPADLPLVALGTTPPPEMARMLGATDPDAVIDLVGMNAALGPLLAQRPARTAWTYPALAARNVAPLITHALPTPGGGSEEALAQHRLALEATLLDTCAAEPWFADVAAHSAAELDALWRRVVAAHQAGDIEAAIAGYRELLAEQPGYAPAQHLLGVLLRDRGQRRDAAIAFRAALAAAPAYIEPRAALANLQREDGFPAKPLSFASKALRLRPTTSRCGARSGWRGSRSTMALLRTRPSATRSRSTPAMPRRITTAAWPCKCCISAVWRCVRTSARWR